MIYLSKVEDENKVYAKGFTRGIIYRHHNRIDDSDCVVLYDRKSGKENLLRCTYVLPDGVTYMKGFVKYPDQARRYLALTDGGLPPPLADVNIPDIAEEPPRDTKKIDLTKNVFSCISFSTMEFISFVCYFNNCVL